MHLADMTLTTSHLNEPPRIISAADGTVERNTGRKRVVIYGAGRGRHEAPLDDERWEVWGLNLVPPFDRRGHLRCDRWFDIHQRKAQTVDDLRWIAQCPVPIYVPDDLLDAGPNCVRFPIERVVGAKDGPFACTFAYQIALALTEGYEAVGVYGVELAYGTMRERTVEWASVNWWIGYAQALGIQIRRPRASRLGAHPFLYGLDYDREIGDVERLLESLAQWDEKEKNRASQGG